jgi:PAS domain S-box-containing protein
MRILIVDDHEFVRRGVRSVLSGQNGFDICGEAVDGRDAILKARELHPDVITMDISMPQLNGLEATREIHNILPDTKVIILSQHDVPEMMNQARRAGANAYVVKSDIATQLIAALQRVQEQNTSFEFPARPGGSENIDLHEILQRSATFEKALGESEERFQLTFEQAAVGMAHVAQDGRWLRVNRKLCEIVGYSEQELRNLTYQQIIHPDDLSAEVELTRKVAAGELDQYSLEERYTRRDGRVIWINLTVAAVRAPDCRLKYFVAVIEDISARKNAEERERRIAEEAIAATAKFRSAFDQSTQFAAIMSLDGVLMDANKLFLELCGYTAEEVLGRPFWDTAWWRNHPDSQRKIQAATPLVAKGVPYREALNYSFADGTERLIDFSLFPIRDERGRVLFLHPTGVDITNAKRLEEAQYHSAAIVESSDDAIVSKDLNGIVRSWNSGAQRIFGFTPEEAIGQPITIIIPPELHDEEPQILARLRAGERIDHFETIRQTKSGELRHISLTISPVRDSHGNIIGASKIARDITERKRNEQLLREAELSGLLLRLQDEERRRLARELHDSAGQLLAVARMNINVAAAEKSRLSPAAAAAIEQNAEVLDHLTTEIRTLSHLLHPPLLDELGLKLALEEYVRGFAQRSGIHVSLDLPDGLERLSQDRELSLFRIVQECLTNIHRHSGSSTAFIGLSRDENEIALEVRDQGHGLSPELQEKLLIGQGSGVGLRGMRERVRQLGGSMQIDSDDSGTSVRVILPLCDRRETGVQPAKVRLASDTQPTGGSTELTA